MRAIFVFLFLFVALTTADSYDDVKAKIQDLIDDGFGKDNRASSNGKSVSDDDRDSYNQEKKMKKKDWRSADYFFESDDEDDSYKSKREDKNQRKRSSKNEDGELFLLFNNEKIFF